MALSKSLNGTKRLITFFGSGNSFNTIFVIIPNVPSDPIIKSFKLYHELFLTTFPPSSKTSPLGRTTSIPLT